MMGQAVELAYETAMRRREIIRHRKKDVLLDQSIASVVNGTEGDRSVPLSSRALEILQEATTRCYSIESRLFPVSVNSVTQAFVRARRSVGLDDNVRLHQFRHSRISIVARKGFNNAQIMAVSGHKDVRSVQMYTHLNTSDVVDLLD